MRFLKRDTFTVNQVQNIVADGSYIPVSNPKGGYYSKKTKLLLIVSHIGGGWMSVESYDRVTCSECSGV